MTSNPHHHSFHLLIYYDTVESQTMGSADCFILVTFLLTTVAAQDTAIARLENETTVRYDGCRYPSQSLLRRDDYEYVSCLGSYKLHTRAVTWNVARRICEDEGAYLAIINSEAEAAALNRLYQRVGKNAILHSSAADFLYIGFHDLYEEGDYVTIHGDSIHKAKYDTWASGQPDNAAKNEHCGSIYFGGGLSDMNCLKPLGFICELKI